MNCVGPTGTNNPNNAKPRSLKIPGAYNEVGPPSTVDLHYNKGVERVTFGNKSTFFTLKNGLVLFINQVHYFFVEACSSVVLVPTFFLWHQGLCFVTSRKLPPETKTNLVYSCSDARDQNKRYPWLWAPIRVRKCTQTLGWA